MLKFLNTSFWIFFIFLIIFLITNVLLIPINNKNVTLRKSVGINVDNADKLWIDKHGLEVLQKVYPKKSVKEIRKIIKNTGFQENIWSNYTIFTNKERVTPYVSIHEEGFRLVGKEQGSWPLSKESLNIFVFGGSTTFGWGVSDSETFPAILQELLRDKLKNNNINVYNFGVGAFILSQEMIAFQRQIIKGNVPDIVIFLDGLNEFWRWDDIPVHGPEMQVRFEEYLSDVDAYRQTFEDYYLKKTIEKLPIITFVKNYKYNKKLQESLKHTPNKNKQVNYFTKDCPKKQKLLIKKNEIKHNNTTKIKQVVERYIQKTLILRGIAEEFNITPLFIIQPIPTIEYDRCYSVFRGDLKDHYRSYFGYLEIINKLDRIRSSNPNIVSCLSVQKNHKENLYVDNVHYNAKGSKLIANCAISFLKNKFENIEEFKDK